MKSILFFDDFLVQRDPSVERRFHTPNWLDEYSYTDPVSPYGMGYASVVEKPNGGYSLYYICAAGKPGPARPFADGETTIVVSMAESEDALSWKPYTTRRAPDGYPDNVLVAGKPAPAGWWVFRDDIAEERPSRTNGVSGKARYLATNSPVARTETGIETIPSFVLESENGLDWNRVPESDFLPHHSDTCNALVYNPITGRYQITHRRRWGERRVYQTESEDLSRWSEPHPIVHPSPADERSTHFYGMPSFYYRAGDIFIGFLWHQQMPYKDVMGGPVVTEYCYSYDGMLWNRTHAVSMPRRQIGTFGGGSLYGSAMIERTDDTLVFAIARVEEHHAIGAMITGGKKSGVLLPGTLRKNGFVGLASARGRGEITTECMLIASDTIRVNILAPLGGVRAQLTDPEYRPIEGFSYEECEEIRGDYLSAPLRWKNGKSLKKLIERKQWVRLQLQLEHAEVFSIDVDCAVSINHHAPVYSRL